MGTHTRTERRRVREESALRKQGADHAFLILYGGKIVTAAVFLIFLAVLGAGVRAAWSGLPSLDVGNAAGNTVAILLMFTLLCGVIVAIRRIFTGGSSLSLTTRIRMWFGKI